MAKKRTMDELRQEKTYGYKAPEKDLLYTKPAVPKGSAYVGNIASDEGKKYLDVEKPTRRGYSEIDIETTKDLIFNQLKNQLFDIMFQAVSEEMEKHEVFQAETYFTPQGEEWFEDEWFQFYHEHHGDILGSIMKDFTN